MPKYWQERREDRYRIHADPALAIRAFSTHGATWLLIGHAYDPWSGAPNEGEILGKLDAAYSQSEGTFLGALDCLSGRFVLFLFRPDGTGLAVQDAVGLRNLFFAPAGAGPCFASHSQLLADVLGLERDPAVDQLVNSHFYGIGIRHLPGLKTPFRTMRMLSANTLLRLPDLTVERFFPRRPHPESNDLPETARLVGDVLTTSIELLSRKTPLALSLSMGTDSRASLAASRRVRDRVHYFSYISNRDEAKDAAGAQELSRLLGLDHSIYRVPVDTLRDLENSELSTILDHNAAYIRKPKPAERAKLHYLLEHLPKGTMEVKTHVSEIGRAFYCKKLGVSRLPHRLQARHMSNLYKRNVLNRDLLRFMDRAFEDFVSTTAFGRDFYNYEEHDMFYWEHRMSAWGSLANQDHDVLHDMTAIFNNRKVLTWLLSPPRPQRIADRLHHEIIRQLWPEALSTPLSNMESPNKRLRKLAERTFFALNRL